MEKLVIHTTVDKNTFEYVEAMCMIAKKLAREPDNLTFVAHCMGPVIRELENSSLISVSRAVKMDVDATRDPNRGTSNDHALCIMDALSMTGDGNIHVIADSDTALLASGWDDYVRQRMNLGIGIIGTTYEDLGGFSSGSGIGQTYKKIPNFIFAALNPSHDWCGLDILPNKRHRVNIDTQELSTTYNLPIGQQVFGEAGWQVPQFLRDNNISYEGWEQLKPTKNAIVLKGLTDYSEEYHVDGNIPFVAHQRGGRKHAFKRHELSVNFFNAVDSYIEKEVLHDHRW